MARPILRVTGVKFVPRKAAKLNPALFKALKSSWDAGIGAFVKTLAHRVHVETGESLASLTPLAEEVGVSLPIIVKTSGKRQRKSLDPRTGVPTDTPRSPFSGRSLGEDAFKITFSTNPLNFGFEFTVPTFQFAIHDAGRANSPSGTMKGASDAALFALRETVEANMRTSVIPIIERWFTTGEVRTI
jgi:hypothetical protein